MKKNISLLVLCTLMTPIALCGGSDSETDAEAAPQKGLETTIQETYEPKVPQAEDQQKEDTHQETPGAPEEESNSASKKYSLERIAATIHNNNSNKKFNKQWQNKEYDPKTPWDWAKLTGAADANVFMKQKNAVELISSIKLSKSSKEKELQEAQKNLATALAMKKFLDHECNRHFQNQPHPVNAFGSLISFMDKQ